MTEYHVLQQDYQITFNTEATYVIQNNLIDPNGSIYVTDCGHFCVKYDVQYAQKFLSK